MAQRLVRLDGHGVPEILEAVLSLLPLDAHSEHKAWLMEVVPGDSVGTPQIWDTYARITSTYEQDFNGFGSVERFAFYERAKQAYAIIAHRGKCTVCQHNTEKRCCFPGIMGF